MGSEDNDHVAPRGAIAINKAGNILLFGDTVGEFFREHTEAHADLKLSELFLMEVTKDGAFKPHVNHEKHDEFDPDYVAPAPTPVPMTTAPPFLVNEDMVNESVSEIPIEEGMTAVRITALVILSIATCLLLAGFLSFFYKKNDDEPISVPRIYIKDGVITVDNGVSKAPPLSTFEEAISQRFEEAYSQRYADSMDTSEEYTSDLQIEGKDII